MEQENRNNYYAPADSQSMAVIRRPEYLAGDRRDLSFGVILAVLAVLFVNCWLWHGLAAGAGLLAAALFFMGICYLWKSRKGLSAYGCVCAALFVAAGALYEGRRPDCGRADGSHVFCQRRPRGGGL